MTYGINPVSCVDTFTTRLNDALLHTHLKSQRQLASYKNRSLHDLGIQYFLSAVRTMGKVKHEANYTADHEYLMQQTLNARRVLEILFMMNLHWICIIFAAVPKYSSQEVSNFRQDSGCKAVRGGVLSYVICLLPS